MAQLEALHFGRGPRATPSAAVVGSCGLLLLLLGTGDKPMRRCHTHTRARTHTHAHTHTHNTHARPPAPGRRVVLDLGLDVWDDEPTDGPAAGQGAGRGSRQGGVTPRQHHAAAQSPSEAATALAASLGRRQLQARRGSVQDSPGVVLALRVPWTARRPCERAWATAPLLLFAHILGVLARGQRAFRVWLSRASQANVTERTASSFRR